MPAKGSERDGRNFGGFLIRVYDDFDLVSRFGGRGTTGYSATSQALGNHRPIPGRADLFLFRVEHIFILTSANVSGTTNSSSLAHESFSEVLSYRSVGHRLRDVDRHLLDTQRQAPQQAESGTCP